MSTKTKKKRPAQVVRMTRKHCLSELVAIVQICFVLLEGNTFHQIAEKTWLHISTIFRLAYGPISLRMQFGTIQALGYAAGITLVPSKKGIAVHLVD